MSLPPTPDPDIQLTPLVGNETMALGGGVLGTPTMYTTTGAIAALGGGGGGLVGFTASLNTASPNNGVNVSELMASGGTTEQAVSIVPTANGYFSLTVPTADPVGGNVRGNNAVDLQIFASGKNSATQVASGQFSAIGGGAGNTASSFGCVVAGGIGNTAGPNEEATIGGGFINTASGSQSVVVGGASNTASGPATVVVGGNANSAEGPYDIVVGGSGNTVNAGSDGYGFIGGGEGNGVTGPYAVIVGGALNTASGAASTISGGSGNIVSGNHSWIPGGQSADTFGIFGKGAWASGLYSISGDTQAGVLIVRGHTTDATPKVLTSDGSNSTTSNQQVLQDNQTIFASVYVLGKAAGQADCHAAHFEVLIQRGTGAASTAIPTTTSTTPAAISAYATAGAVTDTWSAALSADTTNGALAITVTGHASDTINWIAEIRTRELIF